METLARRLEADGPLPTRDAVRLIARLARTVEGLHGKGLTHGRLGPLAVLIPGKRLASARLVRTAAAKTLPPMRAPEHVATDPAASSDDSWAVALLLYSVLTGQPAETAATQRQPLAVFDVGDDALQQLIDSGLHKDPAKRPRSLVAFRQALDEWLAEEGADVGDPLPWDEESKTRVKTLDLSSLPPPPRAEPSRRGDAPKSKTPPPLPKLHAVLDEETTLPKDGEEEEESRATVAVDDESRATVAVDDESRATIPANVEDIEAALKRKAQAKAARPGPRLVPPKIVSEKKQKRKAAAGETIRLDPDETPPFRSPESSPSVAPASTKPRTGAAIAVVAVVAALAGGGYLLSRSPQPETPPAESASASPGHPEEVATGIAEPLRPIAEASARPTSEPSASETAVPSQSAPTSADPAEPVSPEEQCMRAALPSDTFESGWVDLSFVCGEADVVKGARRLREAIVLGGTGRSVTNGMKEWSLLGFFELPTYALVRDRCCPKAGPPSVPASPAICKPTMDDAVFGVMQAARRGEVPTDELAKVDKAARCILRAKQATSFGQHPKPSGGEGTALRTIAKRVEKFLKTRH